MTQVTIFVPASEIQEFLEKKTLPLHTIIGVFLNFEVNNTITFKDSVYKVLNCDTLIGYDENYIRKTVFVEKIG